MKKVVFEADHLPTFAVIDYDIKPLPQSQDQAKTLIAKLEEDHDGDLTKSHLLHIHPGQHFRLIIQGVGFYGEGIQTTHKPTCLESADYIITDSLFRKVSEAMESLYAEAATTQWTIEQWNEYLYC